MDIEKIIGEIIHVIMSEDKLIMVLVLAEGCDERETGFEHVLGQKFVTIPEEQRPRVLKLCYSENNMPFPRPQTECIYYFAPKNKNNLFLRHGKEAVDRFLDDIEIANKMITGMSYTEAVYNETELELIKETEQRFQEEQMEYTKYPAKTQMLRNFAKDIWQSAKFVGKGLPVLVGSEMAFERYSICEQCPHLTEAARCTECGCFMKKKVNLAASSCPIGKWDSVQ